MLIGKARTELPQVKFWNCLRKCDIDIRRTLTGNVIVVGGNSRFDGYCDRFEQEVIGAQCGWAGEVSVLQGTGGEFSACAGGEVMSFWGGLENVLTSRWEYEEHGPGIVDRKMW